MYLQNYTTVIDSNFLLCKSDLFSASGSRLGILCIRWVLGEWEDLRSLLRSWLEEIQRNWFITAYQIYSSIRRSLRRCWVCSIITKHTTHYLLVCRVISRVRGKLSVARMSLGIQDMLFTYMKNLGFLRMYKWGLGWYSQFTIQCLVSAQAGISGSWDPGPGQAPCSVWSLLETV